MNTHDVLRLSANNFAAIALSKPLEALMTQKFEEILITRVNNPQLGWAAAEAYVLERVNTPVDLVAVKAADKVEKEMETSRPVRLFLRFCPPRLFTSWHSSIAATFRSSHGSQDRKLLPSHCLSVSPPSICALSPILPCMLQEEYHRRWRYGIKTVWYVLSAHAREQTPTNKTNHDSNSLLFHFVPLSIHGSWIRHLS